VPYERNRAQLTAMLLAAFALCLVAMVIAIGIDLRDVRSYNAHLLNLLADDDLQNALLRRKLDRCAQEPNHLIQVRW